MATPPPLRDEPVDTTATTTDDAAQVSHSRETDATLWGYAAEVVHYDDAPDECTIHPTDVEEWELVTTWISAQDGSYVSLAEMR